MGCSVAETREVVPTRLKALMPLLEWWMSRGPIFPEFPRAELEEPILGVAVEAPRCVADNSLHAATAAMAGEIRQPIDIIALQKYIENNVPEIKTPLEIKQVSFIRHPRFVPSN
jgi:hypothetical protein